ncbi:MAG: hypothetical protein JXK07_02985 [Spirochaetes bacterium]|nr:hypothetical protein [Spirochaetota bacterium]MBN2771051.1 hypothetical protein [Spirochaetota bacterium]
MMDELDQLTNTIDMAVLCVRAHEPTLFLNNMGDFVSRVKPGVLVPVHWRAEDKKIIEGKLSDISNDVEVFLLEQSELEI